MAVLNVYDGSDWQNCNKLKVWDGSQWQDITKLYMWDGDEWQYVINGENEAFLTFPYTFAE